MRAQVVLIALFVVLEGCVGVRNARKEANCNRAWRISFPEVALAENERIVATEVRITTGRVMAVEYIPRDWSVTIDAGYADRPTVSGAVGHGAGALLSTEELRGFLIVCDINSVAAAGEPKFAIEGIVTTTVDFETTRTRSFAMDELILQRGDSN
jgi:hypothetical protein